MQTPTGKNIKVRFPQQQFKIFRLETTLNYGLERVWCIQAQKGANTIAIGYDEGSVTLKLGREEPAVSMDSSGKILWAKHSEIQQANLKTISTEESEAIQGLENFHSTFV